VNPEIDKSCMVENSAVNAEKQNDSFLSDGWSNLRYFDVNIDGVSGTIRSLDDSGAQLCLVRADVVAPLNLLRIGSVILRDFMGNSYDAEVVNLQMKLADAITFVPVVCAICDTLSSELLLGTDIVDKLNSSWMTDQSCSQSDSDVPVSEVCDVNRDVALTGNSCVTNDIMSSDVNEVTSLTDDGDNVEDDTVVDLDMANQDGISSKSKNVAGAEQLALEQRNDKSLALCFSLADRDKAGYYVRDGILY